MGHRGFTSLALLASGLAAGQTPPGRPQPAPARPPASAPAASQPGARLSMAERLEQHIEQVEFNDAPLERVLEWVEQRSGAMLYVRWKALADVGITRESPVTLRGRNQPLSRILWVIMKEAAGTSDVKLAYQAIDDLIVFSTDDDLSREMMVKAYDVKQIIVDVPTFKREGGGFTAREIRNRTRVVRDRPRPPPTSRGADDPEGPPPPPRVQAEDEALQELADLITIAVEPDSWEVNGRGGRGTIFPYKGRIVVFNSRHVHRIIGGEP